MINRPSGCYTGAQSDLYSVHHIFEPDSIRGRPLIDDKHAMGADMYNYTMYCTCGRVCMSHIGRNGMYIQVHVHVAKVRRKVHTKKECC